MKPSRSEKHYSLYLFTASGTRPINPADRSAHLIDSSCSVQYLKDPAGEKLGEFETRELAFAAMNEYAYKWKQKLTRPFGDFYYTLTKHRPDGLYVAFFDAGEIDGLYGYDKTCIEFILLDPIGGIEKCH